MHSFAREIDKTYATAELALELKDYPMILTALREPWFNVCYR